MTVIERPQPFTLGPRYDGCPMTEDEILGLPDDGYKYELVNGRAKFVPTKDDHSYYNVTLTAMLVFAGIRKHGGVYESDAGFRMRNGNVRCPDVSFMRRERLPNGVAPHEISEGAPDLCVEFISDSETKQDRDDKLQDYFESGAQQVWQVFPSKRRVLVYRSLNDVETREENDVLEDAALLPGFRCQVADLFVIE